jgi:hypothetical protein
MFSTRIALALPLAALVACGGGSAAPQPNGPLALGIIAGQNQVTTAGSSQLSSPVIGRLVRQSNGRVGFQWIERAVDPLLPPKAFAQGTVVTGSPVPGAVVCAVGAPDGRGLVPFTPCTNTDANGQATFYFTPGTVAGEATAEIRGTVENQPAVFDTAKAIVMPGPATEIQVLHQQQPDGSITYEWYVDAGAPIDLHRVIAYVRDKYSNFVAPATGAAVSTAGLPDTLSNWTPTYAVRNGSEIGAVTPDATGWIVTPPAGWRGGYIYLFGTPTSPVHATFFEFRVR